MRSPEEVEQLRLFLRALSKFPPSRYVELTKFVKWVNDDAPLKVEDIPPFPETMEVNGVNVRVSEHVTTIRVRFQPEKPFIWSEDEALIPRNFEGKVARYTIGLDYIDRPEGSGELVWKLRSAS